jgi:hypothetical protein
MKLHSLLLGSLSFLLVACQENQTYRRFERSETLQTEDKSKTENPQLYSLKRIGHRCDLILQNEVKDIFIRTKQENGDLRLTFQDYLEDGTLSLGLADLGGYKVSTIQMESGTKANNWTGEAASVISKRTNENGEPLVGASLIVHLSTENENQNDLFKMSGSIEVIDVIKTGPATFESRPQREVATFENCEDVEALIVGIK